MPFEITLEAWYCHPTAALHKILELRDFDFDFDFLYDASSPGLTDSLSGFV
jgi:hypothetical protein